MRVLERNGTGPSPVASTGGGAGYGVPAPPLSCYLAVSATSATAVTAVSQRTHSGSSLEDNL